MSDLENAPQPRDFESALGELEAIVRDMESGELPLERSVSAYERGMALLKYCQATLAAVEQKVQVLEGGELREFRADGDNKR